MHQDFKGAAANECRSVKCQRAEKVLVGLSFVLPHLNESSTILHASRSMYSKKLMHTAMRSWSGRSQIGCSLTTVSTTYTACQEGCAVDTACRQLSQICCHELDQSGRMQREGDQAGKGIPQNSSPGLP